MLTDRMNDALALVREHVDYENTHNLEGVLSTFGTDAAYEDQPWGDRRSGRDGVRDYYAEVMRALPDLRIDVQRTYVSESNVILEVLICGTHLGPWRGLPPTGRSVCVPLCGVYSFDEGGKLCGERIYYDRSTVFAQLGIFHDPQTPLGRAVTAVTHPVTMLRIAARRLRRGQPKSA